MNIHKRSFVIGKTHGMTVELHEGGERIASAELILPAQDEDIHHCIANLKNQAERYGVRISGLKMQAIFQSIEMGAVH